MKSGEELGCGRMRCEFKPISVVRIAAVCSEFNKRWVVVGRPYATNSGVSARRRSRAVIALKFIFL